MNLKSLYMALTAALGLLSGYSFVSPFITQHFPKSELDYAQVRNTKSRLIKSEGKLQKGMLYDHISPGLTSLKVTYPRNPIGQLIEKQWYWSNLKTPNDPADGYAEVNNDFIIQNLQFPAKDSP